MATGEQYFHLTLGPVQSFVAQARRTRDFWAGSFLLSWLSSVAMAEVEHQGGQVNFPIPDANFLQAIQGRLAVDADYPQQGSVPNRFKALGAQVDQNFVPQHVVASLQGAWLRLCQLVWERDLLPFLSQHAHLEQLNITKAIWMRQTEAFWDISWCLTEHETASDVLDRRKNWRSHHLPPEPGIKCMMMEGFQELSGLSYPDQKKLDTFWSGLRRSLRAGQQDLRPGEILSALGFIKRRFVRHFADFSAELNSGLRLWGWALNPNVPSVQYMAAVPWYRAVLRQAQGKPDVHAALKDFQRCAYDLLGELPETASRIASIVTAIEAIQTPEPMDKKWSGLDGVVFHPNQLELGELLFDDPEAARHTAQALQTLIQRSGLGEASSFYAVLIMDGDQLGRQMSTPAKQRPISQALNAFTLEVPNLVRKHDGFLIYAGGDDVLALVTLDQAMELALQLRTLYTSCFSDANQGLPRDQQITTSLSAAIEFCHQKIPLTFVLHDAHDLLDTVAKDATGRDALAIRVWKPGGLHAQWSQPWDHLLKHRENSSNLLSAVVDRFIYREKQSPFTHRFIFKINESLQRLPAELLHDDKRHDPQGHDLLRSLLTAELAHSGLDLRRSTERDQAITELLEPLMHLAVQHQRTDAGVIVNTRRFEPDALRLVRFLTQEAV